MTRKKPAYKPRAHYSDKELAEASFADQINDAIFAEKQAEEGPFFPDKGITRETLLKYAAECRENAKKLQSD